MKALVEYIAQQLVLDPSSVVVTERSSRGTVFVRLRVPKEELGRVIGREGRLASAMRTLLRVAGARVRRRVVLDITD
ncbi:MAG: KH domain-containing protein [Thermoflexales bacterium]|nr:KH domain-containing protein [Thermoflexales bacterium]MCS7323825.1 KH domain-containing protein [Thermoflexales bacterium]MCX7938311.1 KH domain-containing protein [Thermoflexales bacterium]MDW8054590.1 KH domain-containing protein [Anaerolineae bacterium]MDW8292663.1 KH domain-containing protein [Anaerolineae bacterium]